MPLSDSMSGLLNEYGKVVSEITAFFLMPSSTPDDIRQEIFDIVGGSAEFHDQMAMAGEAFMLAMMGSALDDEEWMPALYAFCERVRDSIRSGERTSFLDEAHAAIFDDQTENPLR